MDTLWLYQLVGRIGNLLRAEERRACARFQLQPVHLNALSYIARSNRFSNTPAALTEFLSLTKGTVSQTLLVLEEKNLIRKRVDAVDRRIVRLALTPAGQMLITELVPPRAWSRACAQLSEATLSEGETWSATLLLSLQHAGRYRSFGVCRSCRHLLREGRTGFRCGLAAQSLEPAETEQICRKHESMDPASSHAD
jgi:MarR family transcriptional regulator, negative regulator of the multidrug operon emrRAB